MGEIKTIEYPQIRYHIIYNENLSLKDLEDLLHLLRISNNDVFYEMGISRAKGNDLQKIEKIEPGSINLITFLKEILSITASTLCEKSIDKIRHRIKKARESCDSHPKLDRPIYCKCTVEVESDGQSITVESNAPIVNIKIKIHNAENDKDTNK